MKKIVVIPNKYKEIDLAATRLAVDLIRASGAAALMSREYGGRGIDAVFVDDDAFFGAELLVVLGGDGAILAAAREYAWLDAPILGINHGRLGFLAELEKTEGETFAEILRGEYTVARHMTLEVTAGSDCFGALNEVVFHRGGFSRMLEFSLRVDNQLVNSYLADGLIIATPTGSTAYSLSAGGPIADPSLEVLIVTPICPHGLDARSIILPANKAARITIRDAEQSGAAFTVDGQQGCTVSGEVTVSGGRKISLVRTKDSSFYEKLRKKIFQKYGA